ncbi:MAG: hypothetical protein HOV83_01095 [Catenulispora sp.]|nr:hypothetical protein [Catenulispora sp.]
MLLKAYVALADRVHELTSATERDRGEGPVPFVVMVAVIAAGALAVGTLIVGVANGWMAHIPTKP